MKIKDLPIGSIIKDFTSYIPNNTDYYIHDFRPIEWVIADKNHEGYPENSVTLIMNKNMPLLKCFDEPEPGNHTENYGTYGNDEYSLSNIRQWLNSDKKKWFVKQHALDAAPDSEYYRGFLSHLSTYFKDILLETSLVVAKPKRYNFRLETVTDKIFLPSYAEFGDECYMFKEGIKFAIFNTGFRIHYTPLYRTPKSYDDNFQPWRIKDVLPVCNIKNDTEVTPWQNEAGIYYINFKNIQLKKLPPGALIYDENTKYSNKIIEWVMADKNHEGYPENSVTLISREGLCKKPFDAPEYNNGIIHRGEYGNDEYSLSNIRQWLNSDKKKWFVKQHALDAAPDEEAYRRSVFHSNINDGNKNDYYYAKESGFLTNFSSDFREVLLDTNISVYNARLNQIEVISDKVFLFSCEEINAKNKNSNYTEGNKLSLYLRGKIRYYEIFYNENLEYKKFITRTSRGDISYSSIGNYFEHNKVNAWGEPGRSEGIVVPVCNIKDDTQISLNFINDKPIFKIKWNQPPSRPSNINLKNVVKANKSFNITWDTSTDTDSMPEEQIIYILERKLDEGSWIEKYRGVNTTFSDLIEIGHHKVTYRVKAVDSKNKESEYTLSREVDIVSNLPPIINSEFDTSLGLKTEPFSISFSCIDEEKDANLIVKAYLDDILLFNKNSINNQTIFISIKENEWLSLSNGEHTIRITVGDNDNATIEKNFTFSKQENEIIISLNTPLLSENIPTIIKLNPIYFIPVESIIKVYVCNNGFDESPTWELIPHNELNKRYSIKNKIKTNLNWGINFKIEINRNNGIGDCYLERVEGTFE